MTGATLGMSLEAIRWVLRDAPDVPAQCVGVLYGLAEHADRYGRGAYPSAATLAWYARKSERQVRYDLMLLAQEKLIRPGDQSLTARLPHNRRPVVYDLAVELARKPPGVQLTAPLEDSAESPGVQPTAPRQSTAPQETPDLQEPGRGATDCTPTNETQGCNGASPGVQPTADKPTTNLKPKDPSRRRPNRNDDREDVERLCAHLFERIRGNGVTRVEVGEKWRTAARLMLDRDGRTEGQIHKAIDWCQDDEFWRSNILSMPKLRDQYEQLRLKAIQKRKPGAGPRGGSPDVSPHEQHMRRQ